METCERLGVTLKVDKPEDLTTSLTFLGITLDTVRMEIQLPTEQLDALKLAIQT